MAKILCIDDTPDQIIDASTNESLRQITESIFEKTPYEIIFENQGEIGIDKAKADNNIKLVLLDVEFIRQKKQGDIIAKDLLKLRPELKIIVLTRLTETGKKISFGHKRNVVHYVIKQEISSQKIQNRLKNLSQAIIEDYENKHWKLDYDGREAIILRKREESFGINIPVTCKTVLHDCIKTPNEPVNLTEDFRLAKARNMVNMNVLEGTDWKTWGIFTKEGCGTGQLKLLIGAVAIKQTISDPEESSFVTKLEFEKFRNEMNDRLSQIEQKLNIKFPA